MNFLASNDDDNDASEDEINGWNRKHRHMHICVCVWVAVCLVLTLTPGHTHAHKEPSFMFMTVDFFSEFLTLFSHWLEFVLQISVAWLVGWALILEYTIGGAAVARGITPNLVLFIYFIVDFIICKFSRPRRLKYKLYLLINYVLWFLSIYSFMDYADDFEVFMRFQNKLWVYMSVEENWELVGYIWASVCKIVYVSVGCKLL